MVETYIYVNLETGYFNRISDSSISDPSLLRVLTMPPSTNHKWFDGEWVALSSEEIDTIISEDSDLIAIEPGTTFETLKEQNILLLDDFSKLTVSKEEKVNNELVDIRHYKNSPVKSSNGGIYINQTGWLSFPALQWSRTEVKKVDFIFYLKGDRYITWGLINENFKPNNTKTNSAGIVCAFRFVRDKIYYEYGNQLTNYSGYQQVKKNCTYRFRINNNGVRGTTAQLFKLAGKERENWHGSKLIWEKEIPLNFEELGDVLTPAMFEKNDSSSPVLGVIVS